MKKFGVVLYGKIDHIAFTWIIDDHHAIADNVRCRWQEQGVLGELIFLPADVSHGTYFLGSYTVVARDFDNEWAILV